MTAEDAGMLLSAAGIAFSGFALGIVIGPLMTEPQVVTEYVVPIELTPIAPACLYQEEQKPAPVRF